MAEQPALHCYLRPKIRGLERDTTAQDCALLGEALQHLDVLPNPRRFIRDSKTCRSMPNSSGGSQP